MLQSAWKPQDPLSRILTDLDVNSFERYGSFATPAGSQSFSLVRRRLQNEACISVGKISISFWADENRN